MTEMEQTLYNVCIGKDYPFPVVDIGATRKYASDIVWSFRKSTAVKTEGSRILKKHVNTKAVAKEMPKQEAQGQQGEPQMDEETMKKIQEQIKQQQAQGK